MANIDPTNPINSETSCDYWTDELNNLRILLNEVDKGILTLIKSGHKSYNLDTGQSSQRVERLDMEGLKSMRKELLSQIDDLEIMLGVGCKPSVITVKPGW
jgi:hypothetical protein